MTKVQAAERTTLGTIAYLLWLPVRLLLWPLTCVAKSLDKHFLAYLTGRVRRDRYRVYSIKFIWYRDSVYLHPMIWGSLLLFGLAMSGWVAPGWLLLAWFATLLICFLTIMYNFNVVRSFVLFIGLVALFGMAYISTVEFAWNPLAAVYRHVETLGAGVTPGFYVAAAYLFTLMIGAEILWAWLFHRVEIDESYVYEHAFLQGTSREPIFARGLKRETKDLLELLILGAADIRHRTKSGYKRFSNVPFASLWLGTAIDGLLDHRRKGEVLLDAKEDEAAEQARLEDALHIDADDDDGGGLDEGGSDDLDDDLGDEEDAADQA